MGSLLVAGTTSDAGKSVLATGICRWLARRGVRVAPFKAQNMSNNSVVTLDGGEIGRAQGLQAVACGLEPEAAMNPILLKPGGERSSHVVVMGRPFTEVTATSYPHLRPVLRRAVLAAYDDLASRHDVVICEGAGGAAEINLREHDLANLGLASEREIPVIVVADIDRGGVFASLFGTVALLCAADQALVSAFVVNRFRGDLRMLDPGPATLQRLTGRPTLGVLPWVAGLAFDAEDSLALDSPIALAGPAIGPDTLWVAAVRLPSTSNATDVDALACEPGVTVRWTTSAAAVADADLVLIPGTRATVEDLAWLRAQGIAAVLAERAASGRPVLGICGGYQMLARTITDGVESGAGRVGGLALLPADVRFAAQKKVGRVSGSACGEVVEDAYVIHHGRVEADAAAEVFLDGCRVGAVWGTTWHGALDSDAFRRAFLREVAAAAGRNFVPAPDTCVAALRQARLDVLADLVADHLDTAALLRLIEHGPTRGLPFVPPGVPG
jgi:adenosylcobyric acid synthase